MSKFADRVREITTTTGTGTFSLGGAYDATYRTFVAGVGTGKPVIYCARHLDESLGQWEVGLGVVTDSSPDTLSRVIVLGSSNANALVNFSAGDKDVFIGMTAWHGENLHQIPRRVKCATTANGTLSTAYANGQTVDSVTLVTGDRVLIRNQTTASENGIYTVNAVGSPTRSVDLYAGDTAAGLLVIVEQGTANADTVFLSTANTGSDIVGTNNLAFSAVVGLSGPGSSTDNAIVRWDGTNGRVVQDGTWRQTDAGKLYGPASFTVPFDDVDGPTITLDWSHNQHQVVLEGNRELACTNVSIGQPLFLRLIQDATGGRTVTWPAGVKWPGGVEPVLTTAPNNWDTFTLRCYGADEYGAPLYEGYINGLTFGV